MFETQCQAIEVREDLFTEYTDLLDATSAQTVWSHTGTTTYFRNSRGRVLFVSPFRNVEYWTRAEKSDIGDYQTSPGS
jgi:4-hydroxyacetophenone monooxygenase